MKYLFLFAILVIIGCNAEHAKPDIEHFQRLEDAGVLLPKNIQILYFFTSQGRDGNFNRWVVFSQNDLCAVAEWSDELETSAIDKNRDECELFANIINQFIYPEHKKKMAIKINDIIFSKSFYRDVQNESVRAVIIKSKNGYYLYMDIYDNRRNFK
ncbi:MAG: hypothetical protein AB7F32_10805 [Victivallaceae bacterium]